MESAPMRPNPLVRPGVPRIRSVYQLRAEAPIPAEGTIDETLTQSINSALKWMDRRLPGQIPKDASKGATFEIELPGQQAKAVFIPELGLWSARLSHPDAPFKDRPAVPGRTWITELCLRKADNKVDFGVRITCGSMNYSNQPIAYSRPRIVLDLASSVGLRDFRPLDGQPWKLRSDADLTVFRDFLVNSDRCLPVIVLTHPELRRLEGENPPYLLDGDWLARNTTGLAHVALLPPGLALKWTQRVGKPWSVYHGAVRTYLPGLDFDEDPPERHPRTLAEGIMRWASGDAVGEKAFANFLLGQMAWHAAIKHVDWGGVLFFADARSKQAEFNRARAAETDDWRKLYDAEITALRGQLDESNKLAEQFCDQATQVERERDALSQQNGKLRFQVDSLRAQLAAKTGESPDKKVPIPTNYEDIIEWAEEYLAGRLLLHPRTGRSLKEACYEDIPLVYRSLLLLANEYRDMRRGLTGSKKFFDTALGELGLRLARSISETRAGEEGDEYYVSWPMGAQRKQFLDSHLRKGTSREHRHCLAIYFFWDEETQQVVVGWLPGHLDNRLT